MELMKVTDPSFKKYGRVVQLDGINELADIMQAVTIPDCVVYEPSVDVLEELSIKTYLEQVIYGELPVQVGYCIGKNKKLNAVEYHRCSEVNIAVTDAVLLVGSMQDITEENTYDTSLIEGFILPANTAVELYATTLHYAPCNQNEEGFKVVVVLPKGTNYPLDDSHEGGEDSLITAKNKWLIGHKEAGLPEGTYIGLIGDNIEIGGK